MSAYVPAITETDLKKIVLSLQQLSQGRSNATGVFTLATGASSTTVIDKNAAAASVIIPIAGSANASAEIAGGTMYLSGRTNGSFTFTHANSATANRTFYYAILG